MRFEWDSKKAETNLKKHGVSFLEAVTVFDDGLALYMDDDAHSINEQRFLVMGMSAEDNLLVVCYTERGEELIRLINARFATRNEEKDYQEGNY